MVPSRIYYAVIAGITKTVRANNKEMAHDYFKKYDLGILISNVHKLPTDTVEYTSDSDVANAEQQAAENWEHNQ
jgi:hypothetical protein